MLSFLLQITSPWAYIFIAVHHNVSETQEPDAPWQPQKYVTGWKDACAVFFYFLITIVMHAVIQEYILDVRQQTFVFYDYYMLDIEKVLEMKIIFAEIVETSSLEQDQAFQVQ